MHDERSIAVSPRPAPGTAPGLSSGGGQHARAAEHSSALRPHSARLQHDGPPAAAAGGAGRARRVPRGAPVSPPSGTGAMLASMTASSRQAVPRKAMARPRPSTCHTPNCCTASSARRASGASASSPDSLRARAGRQVGARPMANPTLNLTLGAPDPAGSGGMRGRGPAARPGLKWMSVAATAVRPAGSGTSMRVVLPMSLARDTYCRPPHETFVTLYRPGMNGQGLPGHRLTASTCPCVKSDSVGPALQTHAGV